MKLEAKDLISSALTVALSSDVALALSELALHGAALSASGEAPLALRADRAEAALGLRAGEGHGSGRIALRELALHRPGGPPEATGATAATGALQAALVELNDATYRWPAGRVDAARIEVEGLAAEHAPPGGAVLRAAALRIEQLGLAADSVRLELARIALPRGAALEGSRLSAPELCLEGGELVIDLPGPMVFAERAPRTRDDAASAVRPRNEGEQGVAEQRDDGPAPGGALRLLDHLAGRIHVDVAVDYTAPVIGRRHAVHQLRIPIADGALDYRALEQSLALLEGSVLDVELRGDRLILEKDIPLVPFDNTTLLSWPLTPEEVALARAGRVRLSRLLGPQVAPPPPDANPSSVELHALELRQIDLAAELGPGPAPLVIGRLGGIEIGLGDGPGAEGITVRGALRHPRADGDQATALELSAASIRGRLAGLQLGATLLSAGRVELGPIERAALAFDGLRPCRVIVPIARLDARDVTLQLAAGNG